MDDWDEDKLDEVIKKKHGQEKSNATDIGSFIIWYTIGIRDVCGKRSWKKFSADIWFTFRFANTFLKQSKIVNMVGFGLVLMVANSVAIDMLYLKDMF